MEGHVSLYIIINVFVQNESKHEHMKFLLSIFVT